MGAPGEHAAFRAGHLPARLVQAADEDVAALLVQRAHFRHAVLRAVERCGGGDLDGGEGAVIQVGFHACEGGDEARIAGGEADAPAGHGVGFRHAGEFDGDLFRARDLQNGRWRFVAEIDFRVGEIRENPDVVLAGEGDQLRIEIQIREIGGGLLGKLTMSAVGLGTEWRTPTSSARSMASPGWAGCCGRTRRR